MHNKLFWAALATVLLVAFVQRIIPILNNNFYFTVDQGYDFVHVREISERHQLLTRGPSTGIEGINAEPGWYYLLAIGYAISHGNPASAAFMMILFGLAALFLILFSVKRNISWILALTLGIAFLVFWPLYDSSRWAFNPFPIVLISVLVILLLIKFFTQKSNSPLAFLFAGIPVILAFHFEVAAATALTLFYVIVGGWAFITRKLSWKLAILGALIGSLLLHSLVKEFFITFWQTRFIQNNHAIGTFSGVNILGMTNNFAEITENSVIPMHRVASLAIFVLTITAFWFFGQKNRWSKWFVGLTLTLFLFSFVFFSLNQGWRDWHTVYLPTLLFTSLFITIWYLPKPLFFALASVIILSQGLVFVQRYRQYLSPLPDPGILANQEKVLDWIYQNNEHDGFNAYTYSPTGYDYPYQYLFWWYGKTKYGFVPCEYAIHPFPLQEKRYVPGALYYSEPKLGCNRFTFLIIEPDKNTQSFDKWVKQYDKISHVVNETEISSIRIQKRVIN